MCKECGEKHVFSPVLFARYGFVRKKYYPLGLEAQKTVKYVPTYSTFVRIKVGVAASYKIYALLFTTSQMKNNFELKNLNRVMVNCVRHLKSRLKKTIINKYIFGTFLIYFVINLQLF